jgi:DNA-binding NarL/FixJ family response regulator
VKQVRVALYASTPFGRAGLVSFLRSSRGITLLPSECDPEADVKVAYFPRLRPEVIAAMRRSAATNKTTFVLVVNEITEAELLVALQCRVVNVLPWAALTPERLAKAVHAAAESDGAMPLRLCDELLKHIERVQHEVLHPRNLGGGLSPREIDVLRLMADGLDTDEIAGELCYSNRTVKNVIYGITRRLNLRNRPHAVAYALRAGVI